MGFDTEIMLIRYVNVRSIINFHSRNQDADFDMLEMFLAFNVYNSISKEEYKTFQKKRRISPKKTNRSFLHYCDTQCTAVLYSDYSLQMGQMGPEMTIFHTPSHTEDVWKIAELPKYCFSFSKQGRAENNNFFTFLEFFFPGSILNFFSLTFCPKIFS